MAARSEAWVCGRSLAEIMGSNSSLGAWMFVFSECFLCCQLEVSVMS